jgi:hypothetical protein
MMTCTLVAPRFNTPRAPIAFNSGSETFAESTTERRKRVVQASTTVRFDAPPKAAM